MHINLLPELNAIVLVHYGPDVAEAAVIDGTFDEDSENADEHEADLHHVGPHHSFHAALQTTHRQALSSGTTQSATILTVLNKCNIKQYFCYTKTCLFILYSISQAYHSFIYQKLLLMLLITGRAVQCAYGDFYCQHFERANFDSLQNRNP